MCIRDRHYACKYVYNKYIRSYTANYHSLATLDLFLACRDWPGTGTGRQSGDPASGLGTEVPAEGRDWPGTEDYSAGRRLGLALGASCDGLDSSSQSGTVYARTATQGTHNANTN